MIYSLWVKTHKQSGRYTMKSLTSGEGKMNLFINDLKGYEVMFLIEPAVVEKQSISFSGSKPADRGILRCLTDNSHRTCKDA